MPGKTKMTATRRRQLVSDEGFGPMAAYQRLLDQSEVWESWDGGVAESKAIAEMAPSYALNALHKLSRWHHHLYTNATAVQYREQQVRMYASSLVAALIEQALGEFYVGTWLQPQQMPVEGIRPAHLDDVVTAAHREVSFSDELAEQLLEASITGADELAKHAHESIGRRARILYQVLATTITTTEAP